MDFTFWDIVRNVVLAARWTVVLTLVAFAGGGVMGMVMLIVRIDRRLWLQRVAAAYIALFQGTPLLLQLFITFFGLPLLHIEITPWLAASVCLTLYAGAFLADIWRGVVESIPRGQWDAAAALGL